MLHSSVSVVSIAALLLPHCAAGLYARNSPVLQLNEKKYFAEIASSNYTSIVEFYAPWCGHCKNLQPAYEKAAKALAGLAKVAAVDCDEDSNKGFCGSMGVQSFPTLKIIKPGKKAGRPFVEDYQGPRTAKGIVDAVKDKITNHVKRLQDSTFDAWVNTDKDQPKAILFTEKGTTSALLKSLAIDFLDGISVAQVRDKEKATCEKYGVTSFPTLVLLPGGGAEPITFKGKLEKPPMMNFLSQAAVPNADPAPKGSKPKSSTTKKAKAASDSSKLSKASASHRSADSASSRATQTSETVISPEGSPNPIVSPDAQKPIDLGQAENNLNLIAPLFNDNDVKAACLTRQSGTCILVINPVDASDAETAKSMLALAGLTSIYNKLAARGKTFKFYNVVDAPAFRTQLGLKKDLGILAINVKKGWIKRFDTSDRETTDPRPLETWIDALRMGEGKKEPIPADLIKDSPSAAAEGAATTAPAEPEVPQSPDTADGPEVKTSVTSSEESDAQPTVDEDTKDQEFEQFLEDMTKEFESMDESEIVDDKDDEPDDDEKDEDEKDEKKTTIKHEEL